MSETVVYVTTLEQWKSVLDVWYEQGYQWEFLERKNEERNFESGGRFLFLDDYITYSTSNPSFGGLIEYSEFMAQQKDDNKMVTVYVTQEQLDLIEELKYETYPAYNIINTGMKYRKITSGLDADGEKALLRYLGGDETVEFKLKEPLYRLWRRETNDRIYMRINDFGTPIWTVHKGNAYTATLDKIKKWQTPAWEIEEVD